MSLNTPPAYPQDLYDRAVARGWTAEVVDRARALRVTPGMFATYLNWDARFDLKALGQTLDRLEAITFGSMRVREATWEDNEKLTALFASSPEQIDGWDVVVERGPYAFAQFRLMENVSIQLAEEGGVVLGSFVRSTRNTIVQGTPLSVRFNCAARVHSAARGRGISLYVRETGPACEPYSNADYWYFRARNFGAINWLVKENPERFNKPTSPETGMPGLPVSVTAFRSCPHPPDANVRPARRADLGRCVTIINRTHRGLDLFRPLTVDLLLGSFDEGTWGPHPPWWEPLYGLRDFRVLEDEGRVVACAGLWDKGRDVRERWTHRETGEVQVVSSTALLDFGYAAGHEEAMARLLRTLVGQTHALGRTHLLAPLGQHPRLRARLAALEQRDETWAMQWESWNLPELKVTRPHVDLRYW
jgi:hypothetical protein